MKPVSLFLAGSVLANVALAAFLVLRAPETSPAEAADLARTATTSKSSDAATGAERGAAKSAARGAAAKSTWDLLRTDDLVALVAKLREAGFPPEVVRRVMMALVAERFDARRYEIEKSILESPFWKNANSYSDPKVAGELVKLQREQTDLLKKILGGTVGDVFASNAEDQAMLRLQIGDIPLDKIDQLYATAMDYGMKRQQAYAARGNNGPMLAADFEKVAALDKAYREDLAKFLTPTEANEFILRQSDVANRLRNAIAPARPTEAEYRAIFPIYQDFYDRFPSQLTAGETPEQAAARKAAQDQMLNQVSAVVGADRAADFKQAGDPQAQQLNRLVMRLDLPISAATQVAAVQTDIQQRVTALREDTSLNGAARTAQLTALQQEATTRVSDILGGSRGLEAYKQYGGQWISNLTPRPPAPPKN